MTKTSLRLINTTGEVGQRLTLIDGGLQLAAPEDSSKRFIVGGYFDSDTGALVLNLANSDKLLVYGFLTPSDEQNELKRGPVGLQGIAGKDGKDGKDGERGSVGAIGEKGPAGNKGPIGLPGKKGLKGVHGDTGKTGVEGEKGSQGEKGELGDVGPRGPIGDPGPSGGMGPVGRQLYSVACANKELIFTFNDGTQRKVLLRRRTIPAHTSAELDLPVHFPDIPNPNRDPTVERVVLMPKYGVGLCGMTVEDAFTALSNKLDNTLSGNTINLTVPDAYYGYFLIPSTVANAVTFQQLDAGEATFCTGGWDGATWPCDGSNFDGRGPMTQVKDGVTWYLYRTDFSGIGYIQYKLTW